ELRNPLAPIRNSLDIMSQLALDDVRLKWSRDVIHRQAMHLTRLVDDLLDISRITRGTINLSREPIEVGAIVTRSVEAVQPLIAEHNHQLTINCDDETLLIEGDPTRLVQILSNLLSNAAKYTDPRGHIELHVKQHDGRVEFRVRDNGVGIPQESLSKLFTLFSRLPESLERQHDGLGIGLALVRKLAELHAGDVTANSEGVNRGSEFVVRLPLMSKAVNFSIPAARLPEVEPAQIVPRDGTFRVLVADDNSDALDSLALLLEMAGHDVMKARSGQEALDVALEQRPDIALLDIGMPLLSGYEVAKRIRAAPWGSRMTLVAVSGWGQSEDKRRSKEAGFDLHLVKPVEFDAVERIFTQYAIAREVGTQRSGAEATR
ncbi:MAG TPA: ATP-binding protein, partial [Steroidobacteraceae bacterium]|nr:ATP-binding protein [Steroidobacteraceae bacterium]